MTILQAIFLGIIQGLTEFLPVSSSGHLAIAQNIFEIDTGGSMLFDIMLHVGTLAAVFVAYRKDIVRMIREAICICIDIGANTKIWISNRKNDEALRYKRIIHNNYRKFVVLILVSTIPTGVIGYAAKNLVEAASATLIVPGVCLLLTGVLLVVADFTEDGKKIPRDVSYTNGFFIGIAQGISTLPGLSRSGTTITACLVSGFDKRFAVKYSFLMAVPAVLGASVLEIKDAVAEEITGNLVLCCVIGAVVAGLVGYVCIKVMLSIVRKKKFKGFAIYCLVLGVAAIAAHFIL
ncbi:MAG: undecaprenyl-diphosphate phosphatase [Lachnospiraceae bacterium]|jgi:undecaprenyl-diphosphatase|uniref:Undecaprenyl-diphosphate phosphatase n=1 Tax=Hominisplanchenecus murintestinalis TaxID=2941517 RepID=A0AC61QWI4_9FIRM|nr:undecaprenyl-diphosphate phosphatase [Hominisplanchenecus murintestinalis]MCI9517534.1 undecaprenyl-diphosphate phosphatase [Lachnospiraceae bacterium]RKJ76075.1 undecaprenyl-diphosphate phosphatase [Anaerotruncus sp. 1XD22-93]MCI9662097.1 undecaprenyl-diphosphate phosphatase [Lachnospiraceae bacterium]NBH99594.1 undecaprenyl-diphosphate phosphatase [Lachnospiraceae bacterium]NBI76904.1 undecaprenyl-diphosphate phosphatase [Lachnospiraceae bacterium]